MKGRADLNLSGGAIVKVGDASSDPSPTTDSGAGTGGGDDDPDCVEDPGAGASSRSRVVLAQDPKSRGSVTVSGSGTLLDIHGDLIIGGDGSAGSDTVGTMNIFNGGRVQVFGKYVRLGQFRSSGSLTLEGPGSRLAGPAALEIGSHGDGTLSILGGASNNSPSTILGCLPGSSGTLIVTGKSADNRPSTYTSRGYFTVGSRTRGTVEISNGGIIESFRRVILGRFPDSSGKVSIRGPNSRWNHASQAGATTPGELIIGDAGSGEMTIRSRAVLEIGPLVIGNHGVSSNRPAVGRLTLSDGGSLQARAEYITLGKEEFSFGTLILDGPDATLGGIQTRNNNGGAVLEVGRHGHGTLVLTNGALLNQPSTILGVFEGSSGTVEVGSDALFDSDGSITIGGESTGVLRITQGGIVNSHGRAVIGRGPKSDGTVTLQGAASEWTHLSDKGQSAPGNLVVGESGSGSLTILDGAKLTVGSMVVGENDTPNGLGSVVIGGATRGPESTLIVRDRVVIGEKGQGFVRVKSRGSQTLNQPVDPNFADLVIGETNSAYGQFEVIGPNATVTWPTSVTVGERGGGGLTIDDGGGAGGSTEFKAGALRIGFGPEGEGSVNVRGRQASLDIDDLSLGFVDGNALGGSKSGTGSLAVESGGLVRVGQPKFPGPIRVISSPSKPSAITVRGANSWFKAPARALELSGPSAEGLGAVLQIEAGGTMDLATAILGQSGGVAEASLTGTESQNSLLNIHGDSETTNALVIGGLRPGRLSISEFSKVTIAGAGRGNVAVGGSESGTLEIKGSGAELLARDSTILVGSRTSRSEIQLSEQGMMRGGPMVVEGASTVTLDSGAFAELSGKVEVNSGIVTVNSGMFSVGELADPCPGRACIVITTRNSSPTAFQMIVRQGGLVTSRQQVIFAGRPTVTGSLDPRTGRLSPQVSGILPILLLDAGAVEIGPNTDPAGELNTIHIRAGGKLAGRGSVVGSQLRRARIVVHKGGELDPNSGGDVALNFTGGYAPKKGDTFGFILPASNLTGQFANVTVTGLSPGFQYQFSPASAGGMALTALNDGVPPTSPRIDVEWNGPSLVLNWPSSSLGYQLETTTSLVSPHWQSLTVTTNGISFSPDGPTRFFRLRK